MLSLATFGDGFLMQPIGTIALGTYIDHRGRRDGLLLTLGLMAVGTASIACMPSYASIGVIAPLLVVFGRLVQGFSAGVEVGGVSVYLFEVAPPGRKGFYVSWQAASQQVAVMFAALVGLILTWRLGRSDDTLGVARASADRLRDHSGGVPVAPLARGDTRIPPTQAPSVTARNSGSAREQLEVGRAWHVADYHEHGLLLPDHRLHADLRRHGASSCA